MEKQQHILGQKVKLKLTQPEIKCSGRNDVSCNYKAKIANIDKNGNLLLEFKFKGKPTRAMYYVDQEPIGFMESDMQDIKLK